LYYTLYKAERYNTVANIYQGEPGYWNSNENLILSEASPSNKVGLMALRLYGLLSIPRLGFKTHPASEPQILLYPAWAKRTRLVPVFEQELRHPSKLDLVVSDSL
jgi:hypothetical protein